MKKRFCLYILVLLTSSLFANEMEMMSTIATDHVTAYVGKKSSFGRIEIQIGQEVLLYNRPTQVEVDGRNKKAATAKVDGKWCNVLVDDFESLQLKLDESYKKNQIAFHQMLGSQVVSYDEEIAHLRNVKQNLLQLFQRQGLLLQDYLLESYLAEEIAPLESMVGANYSIKVINADEPNFFSFPDRTIFLSAGLLSLINTRDELFSVLYHQAFLIETRYVLQRLRTKNNIASFLAVAKLIADIGIAYVTSTGTSLTENYQNSVDRALYSSISDIGFGVLSDISNSIFQENGFDIDVKKRFLLQQATRSFLSQKGMHEYAFENLMSRVQKYYKKYPEKYNEDNLVGYEYILNRKFKRPKKLSKDAADTYHLAKFSSVYHTYGVLNFANKEYQSSIKQINKNELSGLISSDEYYLRALAYEGLTKYDEALHDFDLAMSKNRQGVGVQEADILRGKGFVYYKKGDLKNALINLTKYLTLAGQESQEQNYSILRLLSRIEHEITTNKSSK